MQLDDFDFDLPNELIAQYPADERSASRLLVAPASSNAFIHSIFNDIGKFLRAGDLLVMNDTKVIKARLYGRKVSGGQVEVMLDRVLTEHEALVQIRASHAPRAGSEIIFGESVNATVMEREGELYRLKFPQSANVFETLERFGKVPLPPYIRHDADAQDSARYQTIYARAPGAVAAPTAGLHFDAALLAALERQGVVCALLTLHVGAGTFAPVRTQRLEDHQMHAEWYEILQSTIDAVDAAKQRGSRVIAVGTTSLRALESAAAGTFAAGPGETRLFITPGYRFRIVDALITNFHLPKSTLLMLVSAFAGYQRIRDAYAEAINRRYRFFSYGDAMLLERTS